MIHPRSLTILFTMLCLLGALSASAQRAGFQVQQSLMYLSWIQQEGTLLDEDRTLRYPFGLGFMYETAKKDLLECHFSGGQQAVTYSTIGLGNTDKNGENFIGVASLSYGAFMGASAGGGASHHLNFSLMTVFNQYEIFNLRIPGQPVEVGPLQRNFHLIPALGYRANFHIGKTAFIHLGASAMLQRMSWTYRAAAQTRQVDRNFEVRQFPGLIFNAGLTFWLSKKIND
jgi:hypothetical protein